MSVTMWTEKTTWLSDEEGRKGRIAAAQFAGLIVPDRDRFDCCESEIADITSDLTIVGGRVVWSEGAFASFDENPPSPPMPEWSPMRTFRGYDAEARPPSSGRRPQAAPAPVPSTATITLAPDGL